MKKPSFYVWWNPSQQHFLPKKLYIDTRSKPDQMPISFLSRKTLNRYRQYRKIYPSRKAAFRAAKRDGGIPMSQHPKEVIYAASDMGGEYGLDDRNVRLYIFSVLIGAVAFEYHLREDKEAFYGAEKDAGDQLPHFNSGKVDEGKEKLKKHHYWRK